MPFENSLKSLLLALLIGVSMVPVASADEAAPEATAVLPTASPDNALAPPASEDSTALKQSKTLLQRATASVEDTLESTLDSALNLIGIRYRRGGISPEKGFDCSGFVSHVFSEGLGLYLPHSAKAMSGRGETVTKTELKPGDLVFFNTMRRTFSHVGIYLGDSLFVHAPRAGGRVRIEDMSERYWAKRFNGARRVALQ